MKQNHQPVLLDAVIGLLDPKPGESYFDGTAGMGGHARAVAKRIGPSGRLILVDRDSAAIRYLDQNFGGQAELVRADYTEALERLIEAGNLVDMVLLDLGVSSPQLDDSTRGFSFSLDGPLDMRMDQSLALSADQVVNGYPESKLRQVIAEYGEDRRAKAIARAIVQARPIKSTKQLAAVIRRVAGPAKHIDAATRTFQAIRIEVNDELGQLQRALPLVLRILKPGGRLAIISFHSLEDRLVKTFIARESRQCICPPSQPICTCRHQASLKNLTPKVISGNNYDAINPRARSAKLRAARKLTKTNKEATK